MAPKSHAERVAANVRAEMARSQLTQAALAEAIGMKQQALSRRLSAQTPFSIDELGQIAAVLNIPMAELIGEAVA